MCDKELDESVDYRKMYYHMAGVVESAVRMLIAAQRTCEDMLLESETTEHEHLDADTRPAK